VLVRTARVAFLVAVAVATWLAFRGHGDEILAAARSTPPHAVVGSLALVLVGLWITSGAWRRVLAAFGHPLAPREGRSVFFVGQLGKYVPGGVWSIGAHAHLAAARGVPLRVTAGTSLVFLGLNVATSAAVVGVGVLAGQWPALERWVGLVLVAGGALALVPAVVVRLAGVVAGRAGTLRLTGADTARLAAMLLVTWACYAGAVVALAPDPRWSLLPLAAAAFAVSYVVGVAVVVAPAGLGAREVTLVALLSPTLGLGPAAAVAVLTRLLHTAADLLSALLAWSLARRAPGGGPRQAATTRSRAATGATDVVQPPVSRRS
jgi:uncharacterized membrane protein YbhN (UPF0104 family)